METEDNRPMEEIVKELAQAISFLGLLVTETVDEMLPALKQLYDKLTEQGLCGREEEAEEFAMDIEVLTKIRDKAKNN